MSAYSILDHATGRRLARVTLAPAERLGLRLDGDGSLLVGDLPPAVRTTLFAAGVGPLRRVCLVRSLAPEEPCRA